MNSSSSSSSTSAAVANENIFAVVIPVDPEVILRNYFPNGEINLMQAHENGNESLPKGEVVELPGNGAKGIPPPPGLANNNSKQTGFVDNNNNNNSDNNSNGNGNINNETGKGSNPQSYSSATTTATTEAVTANSNFNSSAYSQSTFNPLALMSFNEFDTPAARDENNEELSLASNQFKLFIDETLRKVSSDNSSSAAAVKARLIIPTNYSQSNHSSTLSKTRWGLKIFGSRADLVQAAKKEIMRSPSLCTLDEDVDLENSLRTSKTIESLLFEEGDPAQIQSDSNETANSTASAEQKAINFPVLNSLSGPLLGPKYHVIKDALAEFDCTISWEGSLALLPTNSSLNFRVSGKDAKSVSSVIQILKDRSDRLDEIPLAVTTLVIESGKLDWIYSSGAIKQVEDALWNSGATLTHLSDSVYQVTCLSGALLQSCLKRLHEILSRHQSVHFTFRYRNDLRDFSTKCSGVFESLAQATDCIVSQQFGNNGTVQVEIGGSAGDVSRALVRLDTMRAQIFNTGSFDLKLIERRLRLHVPAEIRDFICGKKDGKLNRIIKETGVNIFLNVIGGDSMYVDLISEDHMGTSFGSNVLLHALSLIEGELPAEMTFHVPEVHHKRMIGHGGKVIQRIMKKWGVYVKFMNTQETIQCHQLGDPLKPVDSAVSLPLDNVVVRTPGKNSTALKAIKEEIFEECSVSEVTGQFDRSAFDSLKRIQNSSKSRVSISLPLQHRQYLSSILRLMNSNRFVESALRMGDCDTLTLEGEKVDVKDLITEVARGLKNEFEFEGAEGDDGIILVKSPKPSLNNNNPMNQQQQRSLSSCLSDASFKCFPSALFVVQSEQSLSATGSPILQSDLTRSLQDSRDSLSASMFEFPSPTSSVTMNSLASMNSSPPLPVGHQQKKLHLSSEEVNFALAETRRRSADIF